MNIKKSFGVVALIFAITCNAFAFEFPFQGKLTSNDINLRAGPSTNYESLDKLQKEAKIHILTQKYNWYKITLPKTTSCFINVKFLKHTGNKKGIVTGNRVNLRAGPSENASIIGKINANHIVTIIKTHPQWYEITDIGDAAFGWLHKKFVERYVPKPKVIVIPTNTKDNAVKAKTIKAAIKKKIEPQPIARGKIRSMGIFFRRKGSHKLIIDGRLKYYLKGDKESLNRLIGYNVNIFGKIINKENQKIPLIEVEKAKIIK